MSTGKISDPAASLLSSSGATAPQVVPLDFIVEQPRVEDTNGTVGWRDRPWAIAFMVHFGCICFLAFYYGAKAVSSDALSVNKTSTADSSAVFDINSDIFIRALFVGSLSAAVTTVVLFEALRRLAGGLIRASFIVGGSVQILAGVALVAAGVYLGAILILMGALTFAYLWCVRSRIAFAAAHVTIATRALDKAPGLWLVAVACLVAQFLWSLLWGMAALGVEFAVNNQGSANGANEAGGFSGTLSAFLMLVSYFWGSVFIRNVSAFVAASIVGEYWWKGAAAQSPTSGAVHRALTTSFGSLSLGALLVSITRALKSVAKATREKAERQNNLAVLIAVMVIQCLVAVLAAVMEWANHWAIIFCALTGLAFKPAGLAVWDLFKKRGFDMIINDDLVGTALTFASMTSAAVGALAGGALAFVLDSTSNRGWHAGAAAILCFFIALMLSSVIASFVETATRAVFVAWALSPGVCCDCAYHEVECVALHSDPSLPPAPPPPQTRNLPAFF